MNNRSLVFPAHFLLVIILVFAQAARADVLVMKKGDRISGEISRIWDGEVTIEPEYSDEFNVDLSAVEYIESTRDFEIELNDGRKVVGQFAGTDADGNQTVNAENQSFSVPLAELFELDEPEKAFDWESNADFSAAINSGNTNNYNTKLRADTTVKFSDHRHIGELTFIREDQDGVPVQEKDLFKYNYNWLFRDPVFFSTTFSYERDPIIQLASRVIVSAGMGRDIWNTPRRVLSVQLGAGGLAEESGDLTSESVVATWVLRYSQDVFSDDMEVYHNHSITHNINGRTNTSYKTTTGLRYEITDLLYANVSLDYDYESEPVEPATSEDISFLFGLGLEF
jgi:putative salt-induced outer membrane protein YdiY